MGLETRTTDAKGRVSLPKAFANVTVVIEQMNENELRIRKARVIPEDEIRFSEETAVVPWPDHLSYRKRSESTPSWLMQSMPRQRRSIRD